MNNERIETWKVSQLARFWGCSPRTVNRLIDSGELPAHDLGGKVRLITKVDAAAFWAKRRTGLVDNVNYANYNPWNPASKVPQACGRPWKGGMMVEP